MDLFGKKYTEKWTENVQKQAKWDEKKKMIDDFIAEAENISKLASTSTFLPIVSMLK